MDKIRVVVVGMGPIGLGCAQAIHIDDNLQLVGITDIDPAKIGNSIVLDQIVAHGHSQGHGLHATTRIEEAVGNGADVAILTTTSDFAVAAKTIRQLLSCDLAVISSCEQMSWPWYRHAVLADQIDAEAKIAGRAVLGTGVNPGFIMDSLAVTISSMLRRVTRVHCVRRVDASLRRRSLQAKIGATMTKDQFNQLAREQNIGHRGLAESVVLLAAGLNHHVGPKSVAETLEPCLADRPIDSALGLIEPGQVAGIHNRGRWQNNTLAIELDLAMAVGLDDTRDTITLDGPVNITVNIPGGASGDSATIASLVNHIYIIQEADPGLRTMLDLPIAGARGCDGQT